MGYGDFLMASGQAREIFKQTGLKVNFEIDSKQQHQFDAVFKHNPYLGDDLVLKNTKGNRPYVETMLYNRIVFNPHFKTIPGDLFFKKPVFREDYIFLDPHTKEGWSKNKEWGFSRWQELANRLKMPIIQPLYGKPKLNGVKGVTTNNIRQAFKLLAGAVLFVGTDGALHHAAAALNVPSIVLWSGFSHPSQLGYDNHINLRGDNTPPCGSLFLCSHCKDMMNKITVSRVYEECQRYLAP